MAGSFTGFPEISSDGRPQEVRRLSDLQVPHLFSTAFQNVFGICQFSSVKKAEVHMILHYTDVANCVLHPRRWTVMNRDDIHFENVLATRRHLVEH